MRNIVGIFGFFTCFLLIISSCAPKKPFLHYVVEPEIFDSLQSSGYHGKYILVEDNFSPDLRNRLIQINEGSSLRNSELEEVAMTLNSNERNFMLGLVELRKRDYERANTYFEQAANNGMWQAKVLWLDCQKSLGTKMDYYNAYQQLFDKTRDSRKRDIIREHYKFCRYDL